MVESSVILCKASPNGNPVGDKKHPGWWSVKRLNLRRLQGRFAHLVNDHMDRYKMTQTELAEEVGIMQPALSALITGSRTLTGYYVTLFLRKGIFTVDQLYDKSPSNERESAFWDMCKEIQNYSMLHKIARLRKHGIDVDAIIDNMLVAINGK